MNQLSMPRLIVRRLVEDWVLLLSVFIGITVAATLVAGTPVYLDSLEQQSFATSLDRLSTPVLNIHVSGSDIPLTLKSLQEAEQSVVEAIYRHVSHVYLGHERHLKGATSLIGLPARPEFGLPEQPLPVGGGTGVLASRGYFQYLSNLEPNSRFIQGRMAGDTVTIGRLGPELEAVISASMAEEFNLVVGDVLTLAPALGADTIVSAQIVGILEPADPTGAYWSNLRPLLDPSPVREAPPILVQFEPDEPPIQLFVTEGAIVEVVDEPDFLTRVGEELYIRGATHLVGLPTYPLPRGDGTGLLVSLGYFQHLSNQEDHSTFVEGRMAGSSISSGPRGPELEAVISSATARRFRFKVGEVITLTPALGAATVVSAQIVGVFEPVDVTDAYWDSAGVFLDPGESSETTPLLVRLRPNEAPAPLFVTQDVMLDIAERTYPGTLVTPTWSILVDKERLKGLAVSKVRRRLADFEDQIDSVMPGASVNTGIVQNLTNQGERRSFLSRVPLLLLLSVMVVTVLFFLAMMVSYLVQSRERIAAMMRTRGMSTLQLLRLYALEGLVMVAVAVVLAPVLGMTLVAFAGKLPFFRDITGGDTLPVVIGPTPFLVAIGVGLLCLLIFVSPAMFGPRGGLLLLKLQTARPPTVPFFHRYYVDVALLVLGGVTFWELQQRGHIITGGLFKEVEVNEVLLLAPALFLIVVSLVFMRFFPLVVRYISGESVVLVHVVASATVLVLTVVILVRETREGSVVGWLGPTALLLALGGLYWATSRAGRQRYWLGGLVLQGALVAGFLALEPLEKDGLLFVPTIALISLVPAQVAFRLLRGFIRAAPVWLSIGLLHMSRNPVQYSWLVLMLVLVTGLSLLSTTIGGTLERNQTEQIQYDVATDIRVSAVSGFQRERTQGLKNELLAVPGVSAVSQAFRGTGSIGPASAGVLALESEEFQSMAWYRDDFSFQPLSAVMGELHSETRLEPLSIPDGANTIGLWIKPLEFNPAISAFLEVQGSDGSLEALYLGQLGPPEWTLMKAGIPSMEADSPSNLKPPLHLVAVQVFEGGYSLYGEPVTPGTILVDDIHVTVGPSNEKRVLEDFKGPLRWSPILPSALSTDRVSLVTEDAYEGNAAASFSFGNESERGFRGFYVSPTEGPIPIIVSSSLAATSGHGQGETVVGQIAGQWVPMVIKDIVDYFPTLSPRGGGFMVTDLDNLLAHLNVLFDLFRVRSNELFISNAPGADQEVREAVTALIGRDGVVNDGTDRIEALRLDPFTSAGWKPMAFLSPGIGVLVAAVGYVTYLLLFSKRSGNELGALRSLGLSRRQLMGLLGFEHLAIAAIGLGLGTWAGIQMSRLMVSSLAVTETGERVIPPFILMTDWSLMLPTYAALFGVFLAAVLVLNRGMGRLDLHAVARLGEA